jgi:uncharacterized protein DUF5677
VTDRLPELHALLTEPDALASSLVSSVSADEEAQSLAVALLVSAWETYRGIRVLLERRLAEEARMLSRTLLDDAALLMYFVSHADEAETFALRYFYTQANRSELIARAARDAGFEWAVELEAARTAELKELEEAAKAKGIELRQLPHTRQILEELKQHGRLYYWHVRASQTIHSTLIGLSSRFRAPSTEGGAIEIALEAEPADIFQVGVVAAETFIAALAAAARLLGWDEQRVHEFGDAFSPRAQALFEAVTGKSQPDIAG